MNEKESAIRCLALCLLFISLVVPAAWAADPGRATPAFDAYVERVEARLSQQHRSPATFLWASQRSQAKLLESVHSGGTYVEKDAAGMKVSGGLIHHWRATSFIPGATSAELLAVLRDTAQFPAYYKPQVVRAQAQHQGGDLEQVALRMQYRKLITVTLDSRYDVRYGQLDAAHGYSASHSTRIRELEHAGTAKERELEPQDDHGFLWRLNSYWSWTQYPDGVLVQCEAISLTRDVPLGLDHILGPFIFSIPRESLEFTLDRTRQAVLARRNHGK